MVDQLLRQRNHRLVVELKWPTTTFAPLRSNRLVPVRERNVAHLLRPHSRPAEVVVCRHRAAGIDKRVDRHTNPAASVLLVRRRILRPRKPPQPVLGQHRRSPPHPPAPAHRPYRPQPRASACPASPEAAALAAPSASSSPPGRPAPASAQQALPPKPRTAPPQPHKPRPAPSLEVNPPYIAQSTTARGSSALLYPGGTERGLCLDGRARVYACRKSYPYFNDCVSLIATQSKKHNNHISTPLGCW